MRQTAWWRWAGLGLVGVLAAVLTSFNSGERVALNLGFAVLYRVPLIPLILGAFVLGMLTMYLLGLPQDLRVRRALREAGLDGLMGPGETEFHWPEDPETAALRESRSSSPLSPPPVLQEPTPAPGDESSDFTLPAPPPESEPPRSPP